jgi:hypothetical protein
MQFSSRHREILDQESDVSGDAIATANYDHVSHNNFLNYKIALVSVPDYGTAVGDQITEAAHHLQAVQ